MERCDVWRGATRNSARAANRLSRDVWYRTVPMHLSAAAGPLGHAAQYARMARYADNLSVAGGNCSGSPVCGHRHGVSVFGRGCGASLPGPLASTIRRLAIAARRDGALLPAAPGAILASPVDADVCLFRASERGGQFTDYGFRQGAFWFAHG